ncbi:hypothetical protein OU415_26045 [Saccharopolyspora sp. WRP15-2]|uniref:YbaB/EbfC family DNA-binding protein n=1 Tax=Saccharopolyspora oryzae TaxID=2997343 RepID=A0ABT4V6K5_9PSEU|nr:hypothetical protein [Saccharopolyspora oryzae]MDA3628922.1 hypothetical protein [Saccharopolyspora oryzae]
MDGTSLQGCGSAADGQVRAIIAPDGRLADLSFSSELLSRGPSEVAAAVQQAVNAGIDDLARQVRGDSGALGAFEQQLDQLTAGFERTIEKVTQDLAEAQKKLGT